MKDHLCQLLHHHRHLLDFGSQIYRWINLLWYVVIIDEHQCQILLRRWIDNSLKNKMEKVYEWALQLRHILHIHLMKGRALPVGRLG